MYTYYNPNPKHKSTGDCVIRAVSVVTGMTWDEAYVALSAKGFELKEYGPTNNVWRAFLRENGFRRFHIEDNVPCTYTVRDFCRDNPRGTFLLFVGEHVIGVIDGTYYDTFDSGDECPTFFWVKEA